MKEVPTSTNGKNEFCVLNFLRPYLDTSRPEVRARTLPERATVSTIVSELITSVLNKRIGKVAFVVERNSAGPSGKHQYGVGKGLAQAGQATMKLRE